MTTGSPEVPFVDLTVVHRPMEDDLRAAFERVFSSGAYAMGAEVAAFEREFAAAVGHRTGGRCRFRHRGAPTAPAGRGRERR